MALVIAESAREAKNAAELVVVEYEERAAVVSIADAQAAQPIYEEVPRNTCYEWELGEKASTDEAIANAAHVTRYKLTNNRLIPNALEPRAAIADYNTGTEDLTLYTTSQNPHLARLILTAFVQLAPEHKLRVIAPDGVAALVRKFLCTPKKRPLPGRPNAWDCQLSGPLSVQNLSSLTPMAEIVSQLRN